MSVNEQFLELLPWQKSFYAGTRLLGEIQLFASVLTGQASHSELVEGCALIHASFGARTSALPVTPFQSFQQKLPAPQNQSESHAQYLAAADCPDALLYWALIKRLPFVENSGSSSRLHLLRRTALLLLLRYPNRLDLPFQVLMYDQTGALLGSTHAISLRLGQWYTKSVNHLIQLQAAWAQDSYQSMWLDSLKAQIDGRYFPLSDHHIRGFSVVGEAERCLLLFQEIYSLNPAEFQLGSISNMFFMALGCELLPYAFIETLSAHFDRLAGSLLTAPPDVPPLPQRLEVSERPLIVVASSDLRNHPVGRFWLPIARQLRNRFRLIHVAGHPRDSDPIRSQLHELSDDWWPLEAKDLPDIACKIRDHSPSLFLDLGGHTADNHPALLSHRLAAVQATYLGFYGPTYASCCDWWIVDEVLQRWIQSSYHGSEKLWALPGPSLCYSPNLHGLPDVNDIHYRESRHLIFGSFNHTRKLTRSSQKRFGEILSANPDAILQFRSHSFQDSSVRRRLLIRLQDMGIAPHQLQPLPYAPSSAAAMADYGRIHLHFDTFPVSGTTTTLDSLAMGIPVLTCPTPYYAGAISAAILEHAGLVDHVCHDPEQLPAHARFLAERFRTAAARRSLALHVRHSPICDEQDMPRMFAEQLMLMLRRANQA